MAELSEEEKYTRKAALLQKALTDADQMDATDVEKSAAATTKQKKETATQEEKQEAQELAADEPVIPEL